MKEFLPIVLQANRGNWQRFKSRQRNKRFQELEKKVFLRDKHTCRYCGFQSKKFQCVVNHDQNYRNNTAKNMVTACIFCAQCFFLDGIGKDGASGGIIIYLPEVSQADLNHFCRVLFCSMLRDAPYKGKLQTAYLSLKDRSQGVVDIFGPDTGDPTVFGQALLDSGLTKEERNHPVLQHVRLLPMRQYFTDEINYWKSTVYEQIPL